MDNPYHNINAHPSEVTFGRIGMLLVTILFALGILSVPVKRHYDELQKDEVERWLPLVEFWKHPNQNSYNHLFEKRSGNSLIKREEPNLRDHFQSFETAVENSDSRKRIRETEQALLSSIFRKGNRKVIPGKNGWLYYSAGVEAITGLGPLEPEPHSVTKNPDQPEWNPPLVAIKKFAIQLQERDIELVIVPLPVKPMIETSGLGAAGCIRHPDQDQFYDQLRKRGIEVIDLFPEFCSWAAQGDVFLRRDTHWTNATAEHAARIIAEKIQTRHWYQDQKHNLAPIIETVTRSSIGDLVDMLGLKNPRKLYQQESQLLERVLDPETRQPPHGELLSPISIIGDSFLNIYEEPGLGFGGDEEEVTLIGAGFASHLSAYLQIRTHVIAINGQGATGARQAFASLPDNIVRSKKLLLWVIASRDLLLSESAAIRAGVYWNDVEFNLQNENPVPLPATNQALILSGTLRKKSSIGDPLKTSYAEAIYSSVFNDLSIESGEYYDEEASVYMWAFQDRKLLPTARLEPGKRYRLELVPLSSKPDLQKKRQLDDFKRFDLDTMFAVGIEEVDAP